MEGVPKTVHREDVVGDDDALASQTSSVWRVWRKIVGGIC